MLKYTYNNFRIYALFCKFMIQFKNANLYLIQNLRGMKEGLKNKTLIIRKLTRYQVTNNDYNKAYSSTSYLISLHRLFSLIPLSFKNIDFAEVFDDTYLKTCMCDLRTNA